ncbi:MAG: hypothetical protein EOP20_04175 [Hyphomicrobiales bacterium]|nr:MAG: hypothetical protein EOP20_04175 [Hyphomicrobiales bacterium]
MTRLEKTNTDMQNRYERKYVAFIDLLGFSNLVRDSADEDNGPNKVMAVLDRFKSTVEATGKNGLRVKHFSDCLVVSVDATQLGLMDLFTSLRTISDNLLQIDMLVRGAVTVGPFYHTDESVFGPPLQEAYEMESKTVGIPMIELTEEVMKDVDEFPQDLDKILVVRFSEFPDRNFVHYLLMWSYYDAVPRAGAMVLDEPGQLVRHYIAKRLADHTGSVREKAAWMKKYWDETVAAAGYFPEVDEDADLPYPVGAMPFRTKIMQIANQKS